MKNSLEKPRINHSRIILTFISGKFISIEITIVQLKPVEPLSQPVYSIDPLKIILAQILMIYVGKFVMVRYDVMSFFENIFKH